MLVEVKNKGKGNSLTAILWDGVNEPRQVTESRNWTVKENGALAKSYFDPSGWGGADWLGAANRAELFRRLSEGWAEGARRLSEVEVPDVEAKSVRRRKVRGDQGDWIDMQAVYRGDLSRAWTRTRKRETSAPRSVSVVINLGANCGVTAESLAWRGISALRLCESLTEAGYSVAIYGTVAGRGADISSKVDSIQLVEIKAEDQPLDLDRLAALTIMPGWFRTSGFAGLVLGCDAVGAQACTGLGKPDESRVMEAIAMLPVPQRVFLQPLKVLSRETANEWVAGAVKQIEADAANEAEVEA